ATGCGFNSAICDTVRMYIYPALTLNVSPNPASFCPSSTGVTLTANVTGGLGTYSYTWKNSGGTTVGSSSSYFATSAGTYKIFVRDQLSPACPTDSATVTVAAVSVSLTTARTNVVCNGSNTGVATVT